MKNVVKNWFGGKHLELFSSFFHGFSRHMNKRSLQAIYFNLLKKKSADYLFQQLSILYFSTKKSYYKVSMIDIEYSFHSLGVLIEPNMNDFESCKKVSISLQILTSQITNMCYIYIVRFRSSQQGQYPLGSGTCRVRASRRSQKIIKWRYKGRQGQLWLEFDKVPLFSLFVIILIWNLFNLWVYLQFN